MSAACPTLTRCPASLRGAPASRPGQVGPRSCWPRSRRRLPAPRPPPGGSFGGPLRWGQSRSRPHRPPHPGSGPHAHRPSIRPSPPHWASSARRAPPRLPHPPLRPPGPRRRGARWPPDPPRPGHPRSPRRSARSVRPRPGDEPPTPARRQGETAPRSQRRPRTDSRPRSRHPCRAGAHRAEPAPPPPGCSTAGARSGGWRETKPRGAPQSRAATPVPACGVPAPPSASASSARVQVTGQCRAL